MSHDLPALTIIRQREADAQRRLAQARQAGADRLAAATAALQSPAAAEVDPDLTARLAAIDAEAAAAVLEIERVAAAAAATWRQTTPAQKARMVSYLFELITGDPQTAREFA